MVNKYRFTVIILLLLLLVFLLRTDSPIYIFNSKGRNIILLLSTLMVIIVLSLNLFYKKDSKSLNVILVFLIVVCSIFTMNKHLFAITKVVGESMSPNLHTDNLLFVGYNFKPKRYDVVVINSKGMLEVDLIVKRVIGLPGETVEIIDNEIYINYQLQDVPFNYNGRYTEDYSITIPEGFYLVLGDNRSASLDSRGFGLIERNRLLGKVLISR